jgi:apolipoprotein N-acyltransferase
VVADLARQFIATGFPWNLWGSVWALPGVAGDVFLQPAALVGVHGLTLATIVIAATPLLGARAMTGAAAALALWAGWGYWRLDQPPPQAPGLTVVLVQGNVPQGQKWDRAFVTATFLRYLNLTGTGLAQADREAPGQPVVVVWPETASPYLIDVDANARAAVAAATHGATVLTGSVRFDSDQRPRNSLMAVQSPGPPVGIYDKWHLVPFGEYQPSWFPLPIQVVPGGGFARGPGPQTLHIPSLPPVGPLICYEAIFPGQVVDRSDRPDWMVNVTNDAWFGNSSGPRQHLAAARLRAVEEGLPLLRAANTGISAAFDAFGREQARLELGQTGVVVTALPGKLPPPLFARIGLPIPVVLAVLALAAGWLGTRPILLRRRF